MPRDDHIRQDAGTVALADGGSFPYAQGPISFGPSPVVVRSTTRTLAEKRPVSARFSRSWPDRDSTGVAPEPTFVTAQADGRVDLKVLFTTCPAYAAML
jgi:hypothetical protein